MSLDTVEMAAGSETVGAPMEASTQSWLDSIKERFSSQEPWAIDLVIFGLGGFVTGFLLKNFGRMALISAVLAIAVIVGLHYTHVYDMPFEKLQELLNITEMHSFQDIVNAKIAWAKEHPVAIVSGIVGILVGWKVG